MLPLPASSSTSSIDSASRSSASEDEWTRYKSMLWELWKHRGMTTVQVKQHMWQYYQFHASKQAFDRHFKAWGWGKNLKAHEWHQVKLQLEKRSRDTGKESEVELKGTTVQASKRVKRHHLSYVDGLQLEQRQTALPEGVFINDCRELAKGRTILEQLPSASFLRDLEEFLGRYLSSRDRHNPEVYSLGGSIVAARDVLDMIVPTYSVSSNDLIHSFANTTFSSTQCFEIFHRLKASDHSIRVLTFRALTTIPGVVADLASLVLLLEAAKEDDLSAAKALLPRLRGFLNQPLSIDFTHISRPIEQARSVSMFKLFVEHGADPKLMKNPFRRLLFLKLRSTELMHLYQFFIQIDHPDTENSISIIASVSNLAVLRLLASKFNGYHHFTTIVAWAVTNDQPEIEKFCHKALKEHAPNLNLQLLLAIACIKGDLTIVQSLIKRGIDLNESVKLPLKGAPHIFGSAMALQYAIGNGHMTIATILLNAGASPFTSEITNLPTPLELALLHKDSELARKLLQGGALVRDVSMTGTWEFCYDYCSFPLPDEPISLVRLAVNLEDIGLINDLLEAGADLNEALSPESSGSVVTNALEMGDLEFAKFLFQKGALITMPRPLDDGISWMRENSAEIGYVSNRWTNLEHTTFSALHYISVWDLKSMGPNDLQISQNDLNAFFLESPHHGHGDWLWYQDGIWKKGRRSLLAMNQGDKLPRLMTPLTHAIYWCQEHDNPDPLHYPSCRRAPLDHRYVRELIRLGAHTNVEGELVSALAYAVERDCQECVDILLHGGSNRDDEIAVRYAVRRQNFDLLLKIVPSFSPLSFDPLRGGRSFQKVPLPHETARGILKGAVESSYEHGSDLLQRFLNVIDVEFSAPCMVTVLEDVGNRYTEDSLKRLLAAGVPTADDIKGDSYPCCGYEREEYSAHGRTSLLWTSMNHSEEEYKHDFEDNPNFEKEHNFENPSKKDLKPDRLKFLLQSGFRPVQVHKDTRQLLRTISRDHKAKSFDRILHIDEITELRHAIRQRDLELVKCLVNAGANAHAPARGCLDFTALQEAVICEQLEMVQYLLQEQGVSPNEPPAESYGGTALQLASVLEVTNIARVLLRAGADVNAPGAGYDDCACHFFRGREESRVLQEQRETPKEGDSDCCDCLDIDFYEDNSNKPSILAINCTALEGAVKFGRLDTVALLLDHGADISDSDFGIHQYKRATRLAYCHGRSVIAKMLNDRRDKMKSSN